MTTGNNYEIVWSIHKVIITESNIKSDANKIIRDIKEKIVESFICNMYKEKKKIAYIKGKVDHETHSVFISLLYVRKPYRNLGMGKTLMYSVIEKYGEKNNIFLTALIIDNQHEDETNKENVNYNEENLKLVSFYEKLGFEITTRNNESENEFSYSMMRRNK